jgi:hypothetical protein
MALSANKVFDSSPIYAVGVSGKVVCINGVGKLRRVILGKEVEVDIQRASEEDLHFIKFGKQKDDKSTNNVTVNDSQGILDYLIVETRESTKAIGQ